MSSSAGTMSEQAMTSASSPGDGQHRLLQTPPSSNAQLRKIKKPLIERRRRERINECLSQIKTLVLEATNKDETRYSKMEKADILEMTVAHLKSVHVRTRCFSSSSSNISISPASPAGCRRSPSPVIASQPSSDSSAAAVRYVSGYSECMREVAAFLNASAPKMTTGINLQEDVRQSLVRHLDGCLRTRAVAVIPAVAVFSSQQQQQHLPMDCTEKSLSPAASSSYCRDAGIMSLGEFRAVSPMSDKSYCSSSSSSGGGVRGIVGDLQLGCSRVSPTIVTVKDADELQRRVRCDSGMYSGASSPAQDDEPELMRTSSWERRSSSSPRSIPAATPHSRFSAASTSPWPQLPSSPDASDVWRPW